MKFIHLFSIWNIRIGITSLSPSFFVDTTTTSSLKDQYVENTRYNTKIY